jgi:hypothetical protein
MKCLIDITDPENVIRVKDAAAYQLVNGTTGKTRGRINGNYDYCPKTKFKRIHGTKAQKAKIAGFAPPSEKG